MLVEHSFGSDVVGVSGDGIESSRVLALTASHLPGPNTKIVISSNSKL